jgi:hypothetical protein
VTGFAAITLAAVVLQVTVIAVTVTAPAVCMADRSDTGAAMCGAARAPTMGPWFRRRLELAPSPPLRSRRLAPFDSVGSCWRPASPPFAVILRDTNIACAYAMHGSALWRKADVRKTTSVALGADRWSGETQPAIGMGRNCLPGRPGAAARSNATRPEICRPVPEGRQVASRAWRWWPYVSSRRQRSSDDRIGSVVEHQRVFLFGGNVAVENLDASIEIAN